MFDPGSGRVRPELATRVAADIPRWAVEDLLQCQVGDLSVYHKALTLSNVLDPGMVSGETRERQCLPLLLPSSCLPAPPALLALSPC